MSLRTPWKHRVKIISMVTASQADCGRAGKSLLAAAARSSAKAQSVLGTMYATGHCVTRDVPTAYRWFAKALHQDPGNVRLQRDLEVLWAQMTAGRAGSSDEDGAVRCLTRRPGSLHDRCERFSFFAVKGF